MNKKLFTSVALAAMLTVTTVAAAASDYAPSVVMKGGVKPAAPTCVGKDALGAEVTVDLVTSGTTGTSEWYLVITPFDSADAGMNAVYTSLNAASDLKDFASKVEGISESDVDGYQVVGIYDASIVGTKPDDITVEYSVLVDGIKSGDDAKLIHFSATDPALKADVLTSSVQTDNSIKVTQKDFSPILVLKKTNSNPAQPTGSAMNYGVYALVGIAMVSSAAVVVVSRKRRSDAE